MHRNILSIVLLPCILLLWLSYSVAAEEEEAELVIDVETLFTVSPTCPPTNALAINPVAGAKSIQGHFDDVARVLPVALGKYKRLSTHFTAAGSAAALDNAHVMTGISSYARYGQNAGQVSPEN